MSIAQSALTDLLPDSEWSQGCSELSSIGFPCVNLSGILLLSLETEKKAMWLLNSFKTILLFNFCQFLYLIVPFSNTQSSLIGIF